MRALRQLPEVLQQAGHRSAAVVRLGANGSAGGELGVARGAPIETTEEEWHSVAAIGHCLSVGIAARRVLHKREERGRIAELLATLPSLRHGAAELGTALRRLVPHDVALVRFADEPGQPASCWRITEHEVRSSMARCAIELPERPSVRAGVDCDLLAEESFDSALIVPLRAADAPPGMLVLVRRSEGFSEDDCANLSACGHIMALAFHRIHLEQRVRAAEQQAAVGGITSMLAHEVRNPLNSLALHA